MTVTCECHTKALEAEVSALLSSSPRERERVVRPTPPPPLHAVTAACQRRTMRGPSTCRASCVLMCPAARARAVETCGASPRPRRRARLCARVGYEEEGRVVIS